MFRKRKRRHRNKHREKMTELVYGYYDGQTDDDVYISRKKKNKAPKIKRIMGLTQGAFDLLCESIPVRTDISVRKKSIIY